MNRKRFQLAPLVLGLSILIVVSFGYRSALPSVKARLSAADVVDSNAITIRLSLLADGLTRPVGIANMGDFRLFVIEQAGLIKIVEQDGTIRPVPFLDTRHRVDSSDSEEGLLGLAFHPEYRVNGLFYVNYTYPTGDGRGTRISQFQVTNNPNVADPNSEKVLLTVEQPYANHNAGKILFGPDGYLYIPLGDGGSSYDPQQNAQNPEVLLGKISRIDVDGGQGAPPDCVGTGLGGYTVPADNPAIDGPGGTCDEIWASGLRNPWQTSFDSQTGELFIADVGQSSIEEIDFQPADSSGGENYGWDCYEGSQKVEANNDPGPCQAPESYVFPIFEYDRPPGSENCSVTGGYVYRGYRFPSLFGRYLLTDFCSGRFWDLRRLPDATWQSTEHSDPELLQAGTGNAAFGERCDGELFLANVVRGELYQIIATEELTDRMLSPNIDQDFTPYSWQYLPLVSVPHCR